MGTHLFGQSQAVADSFPANQGDGATESPNSQRIRESAYRVSGRAIHGTRWIEGVLMLTNRDITYLSDSQLDREVQLAMNVVDALPATELDEIAQKAGL
jgi:hypothetical protein